MSIPFRSVMHLAIPFLMLLFPTYAAQASETNTLSFSGTIDYRYSPYGCPNQVCNPVAQTVPWQGAVTIVTDSAVDGSYTSDHLLSFRFVSASPNWQTFVTDGKATGGFVPATLTVTLAGGLVTAINGSFIPDPYQQFSMTGMTASYLFGGCHHCDSANGSAVLFAVPEAPTSGMLLAGLALLIFLVTRSRREG